MNEVASSGSMDEETRDIRLKDLQRFEAMTKREVTDLKKSLGILGA
jgi:hypothetical protein